MNKGSLFAFRLVMSLVIGVSAFLTGPSDWYEAAAACSLCLAGGVYGYTIGTERATDRAERQAGDLA